MPRLRQVPKSEAPPGIVQVMYRMLFDERDPVAHPGTATGTPGDWWTVFALVPDVLEHAVRGFSLYRSESRALAPVLRELGPCRAGWARGMDDAKIEAVAAWATSDRFDATERAVLAYTDALVLDGGRVADATFAALRAVLSDEAILELTYITCMYEMHATVCRALRLEFDDRDEAVVEVPGPDGVSAFDIGAMTSGREGDER